MWIKKLPGIVANAAVLILNVFAILMIVGLFLHQGTTGERVKETITRFSTTSQEYYAEGEAYSQTSDRGHTYSVEETRELFRAPSRFRLRCISMWLVAI